MTKPWLYTMQIIFNGTWLAADCLRTLQLTLQDPETLGARFFWRHFAADSAVWQNEAYEYVPGGRWLYIQWEGEAPRPMTEVEEAKVVRRLHDLGFYEVTQARLWDILAPTLPHDGYGRRDTR